MKYILLLLVLMCGSVQGQESSSRCYGWGIIYDHDYWNHDDYSFVDSIHHTRRFDRWYPDTVQVCDTLDYTETARREGLLSGLLLDPNCRMLSVTCRDTTIYAKRIPETETKWVIPK